MPSRRPLAKRELVDKFGTLAANENGGSTPGLFGVDPGLKSQVVLTVRASLRTKARSASQCKTRDRRRRER